MFNRIMRAIRLDRTLFREVADNPEFMREAAIIAVLVAFVVAVGGLFSDTQPLVTFFSRFVNELLFGWVLWSLVAFLVGTRLFKGRSSPQEMLRTLAYAGAPRLLGVFFFIPCVGWIFAIAGWMLSIYAGIIAIRESMEFDTNNAVITVVLGLGLYIIASIAISLLFPPGAALGF